MEYTGKYHVGQVFTIGWFADRGNSHHVHEVEVTGVWTDDNDANGVTIQPTRNYGFPIDMLEEVFDKKILKDK